MMRSPAQTAKLLNFSLLFAGLSSLIILYKYKYAFKPGKPDAGSMKLLKDLTLKDDEDADETTKADDQSTPTKNASTGTGKDSSDTPLHSNKSSSVVGEESTESMMTELHAQIEEIDKRGKAMFKAKKYLDAADVFTEALDLIHSKVSGPEKYGNLNRQMVTLMNNRSAMYEKATMSELALHGTFVACCFN